MQLITASLFAGLVALASAQGAPNLAGLPSCAVSTPIIIIVIVIVESITRTQGTDFI